MKTIGLSVMALAVLTACGGSGTSAGNGSTLGGVVVDGLIQGASVCLDLNVNLTCDAGEPSATTGADGSYSLSLGTLTTAQIRSAHIITSVPTTAKDADDGGKTLAEAGKAAFNLMSPAEAFVTSTGTISSAVVSPLTTMISHEMISGKTAAAAEAAVVTNLGETAGTDLKVNFVGKTDNASIKLQKRGRQIAAALGELKKLSATAAGTAKTADRDAQLGALDYLKTNVAKLVAAADAAPTNTTAAEQFAAVKAALVNPTTFTAPVAATMIANAQALAASSTILDAVSTDWAQMIDQGFYNVYCSSGTQSINGSTATCAEWAQDKVIGNGPGKWAQTYFTNTGSTGAAWVASTTGSQYTGYKLASTGWVNESMSSTGTYVSDNAGGINASEDGNTWTEQITMVVKDVSGKTFKDLIGTVDPHVYNELANMSTVLPASFLTTVLPTGSKRFVMNMVATTPRYYLWNQAVQVCISACAPISSLAALISSFTTGSASAQSIYLYSNSPGNSLSATFDAGGTATGGTLTVSRYDTATKQMVVLADKGSYKISTVNGQELMVVLPPPSVISARATLESENLYAVRAGAVYQGSYQPEGYRSTGGSNWNLTAINALLAAAGLPATK